MIGGCGRQMRSKYLAIISMIQCVLRAAAGCLRNAARRASCFTLSEIAGPRRRPGPKRPSPPAFTSRCTIGVNGAPWTMARGRRGHVADDARRGLHRRGRLQALMTISAMSAGLVADALHVGNHLQRRRIPGAGPGPTGRRMEQHASGRGSRCPAPGWVHLAGSSGRDLARALRHDRRSMEGLARRPGDGRPRTMRAHASDQLLDSAVPADRQNVVLISQTSL